MGAGDNTSPAARAGGFLARIKAQQTAGRARSVVLRLPHWLRGETELIELTRIDLASVITTAAGVSEQAVKQVTVTTRLASHLRNRETVRVPVDFLCVQYESEEVARSVLEVNQRVTESWGGQTPTLNFHSRVTRGDGLVKLPVKLAAAGEEARLLDAMGEDAGLVLVDGSREAVRLVFTRVAPDGQDTWDLTDLEILSEFGGLVQRQLARWFVRNELLRADAVGMVGTRTRWVARGSGHRAAVGVYVDLLLDEVPRVVPRKLPLDDSDEAWKAFECGKLWSEK